MNCALQMHGGGNGGAFINCVFSGGWSAAARQHSTEGVGPTHKTHYDYDEFNELSPETRCSYISSCAFAVELYARVVLRTRSRSRAVHANWIRPSVATGPPLQPQLGCVPLALAKNRHQLLRARVLVLAFCWVAGLKWMKYIIVSRTRARVFGGKLWLQRPFAPFTDTTDTTPPPLIPAASGASCSALGVVDVHDEGFVDDGKCIVHVVSVQTNRSSPAAR